MTPYIYFALKKLVLDLLKLFIVAKITNDCKAAVDIGKINGSEESNWIKLTQLLQDL